ncbi:hypothetical protein Bca4012_038175 [Brassica carinata]
MWGDELMSIDMLLLDSKLPFLDYETLTLVPATINANRVPALSSNAGEKEIEFFFYIKKGKEKEKLNKDTHIPSFILMKTSRKIINQGVPSFSCQGGSGWLEGSQRT